MQLYNFIFKSFIHVIKKKLLFLWNLITEMLQRIQTLYLLIAALFSGVLSSTTHLYVFDGIIVDVIDSLAYLVLFLGSALLSIISIFLFKSICTGSFEYHIKLYFTRIICISIAKFTWRTCEP